MRRGTALGKSLGLGLTALLFLTLCLAPAALAAGAKRLVVIKVDGLPYASVDRFVRERDPRTGKSLLPWFERVFYQDGTRLAHFYVRGMSLSGPSWSILQTGQHLSFHARDTRLRHSGLVPIAPIVPAGVERDGEAIHPAA